MKPTKSMQKSQWYCSKYVPKYNLYGAFLTSLDKLRKVRNNGGIYVNIKRKYDILPLAYVIGQKYWPVAIVPVHDSQADGGKQKADNEPDQMNVIHFLVGFQLFQTTSKLVLLCFKLPVSRENTRCALVSPISWCTSLCRILCPDASPGK